MPSPYRETSDLTRLPGLWAFTDPERTPDVLGFAANLPAGTGLVYRHFGSAQREREARALARSARQNGLLFLIAADPVLARQCGAHGVHWPERLLAYGAQLRARGNGWIMTAAAHSRPAISRAERAGMDAVFLSPLLTSKSPSAIHPLGLHRAGSIARSTRLPVYGLGGLGIEKAKRLEQLGLAGLAMIDGWLQI